MILTIKHSQKVLASPIREIGTKTLKKLKKSLKKKLQSQKKIYDNFSGKKNWVKSFLQQRQLTIQGLLLMVALFSLFFMGLMSLPLILIQQIQ